MSDPRIAIYPSQIRAMVNEPSGGIMRELRKQAGVVAVRTKAHLNVRRPPNVGRNTTGVPYRRTGDLRNSIEVDPLPTMREGLAAVGIISNEIAVHDGVHYAEVLLARGFRLAPDEIFRNQL